MTKATNAFAVITHYALLCPSTDAIMGEGSHVVARFATKAEADAYVASQYAEDDSGECSYTVAMKPYREGEDKPCRPLYTMPELQADAWAHNRDAGAPDWAL